MNLSAKTRNLLQFAYLSSLLSWCLGFQVFLAKLALQGRLLFYRTDDGTHFTDFVVFYNWWRIALSDQKQKLYDPLVQMSSLSQMLGPLETNQLPFIQGTPFFFILGLPFAGLNLHGAFLSWNLLGIGLCLWGISACFSLFQEFKPREKLFLLAALLASFPFLSCERDGQTGALLCGLLSLFAFYWLKRKDPAAGFILSTLIIKPQYLPFFAILPLAYGRWKVLIYFCAGLLCQSLAAAQILGLETLLNYPRVLFGVEASQGGYLGIFTDWMVSLRGVLIYLCTESQALQASFVLMLACLFWLFLQARKVAKKMDKNLDAQFFSVTIMAALVFSPHTYTYDLHLVALAALLSWFSVPSSLDIMPQRKIWKACMLSYPFAGMLFFIIMDRFQIGRLNAPFHLLPNLVLLICSYKNLLLSENLINNKNQKQEAEHLS